MAYLAIPVLASSAAEFLCLFHLFYFGTYIWLYVLCRGTRYKFQEQYPPASFVWVELKRCYSSLLCGWAVDNLVHSAQSARLLPPFQQGPLLEWAPPSTWALSALALLFWGDTHFYFTHRLLHDVPWLYAKVHKVHHESRNPDPFSGASRAAPSGARPVPR